MRSIKAFRIISGSRLGPKVACAACAALALAGVLSAQVLAPTAATPAVWQKVDIARDWRFQADPENVGVARGWASRTLNDAGWARLEAGHPWEEQGFPSYDGYAWYRRAVTIPAGWQRLPVYLWLAGVDDELDVFVEDKPLGHFGERARGNSANREVIVLDLSSIAKPGKTIQIAIRVNDWGGAGGLTTLPAAISTSNTALYTAEQYVKYAFQRYPDIAWPYWLKDNNGIVRQRGAAWAMTGTEGGLAKALLGLDSTVMPAQDAVAITAWLYDSAAGQLYTPSPSNTVSTSEKGHIPVFSTRWIAPGAAVTSTLFVAEVAQPGSGSGGMGDPAAEEIGYYSVTVGNESDTARQMRLLLALRPYGVAGRLSRLVTMERRDNTVLVNGDVAVVADQTPNAFGAIPLEGGDISLYARQGIVPPSEQASDARGLVGGAMLYFLDLAPRSSATLTFKLPVQHKASRLSAEDLKSLDFASGRGNALRYWDAKLDRIRLSLPDNRYVNAYYASLANLLLSRNGDWLLPGPSIHRKFWYRDAAYLSIALLAAGRPDVVAPVLEQVKKGQLASGEFPPVLEVDGRPASKQQEWDSQGEGIFALVSYYRWTNDTDWLRQAYPTIRKAAGFLRDLRAQYGGGILPPSESAEDLGPADWHHYWDDFWAIAGLRDSAFAATVLGEQADARWMAELEAELRQDVADSIAAVQQAKGLDYIPNGPEDTDSSAMARGTTPALWPTTIFDPGDPLLRRSFQVYYDRWVAPNKGAYRHYADAFWPFAGLQLAHVYLILDMPEKVQAILDWTLTHETFPGLGVWADSVSSSTNRLVDGDMPHAWFAAELTLLLRDMLVREDGDRLVIGSYLPPSWYADGKRISVGELPTLFGSAGFQITSHAASGYWDLTIDMGTKPPAGYLWKLPSSMRVQGVTVDGQEWHDFDKRAVRLPPSARSVRLHAQY